jgi:predicted CXXCH cytochrome family protein
VHGPAGAGTCIYCHNPHGSPNASFLSRTGRALCRVCHQETDVFFTGKVIHAPLEDGDCIACHDPHQSDLKYQIRTDTAGSVCFKCHERNDFVGKKVTHDPVDGLTCVVCHNPHSAENAYLLDETGNAVCFACHEDKKTELQQASTHSPADEDCRSCHVAHTSDFEGLLKQSQERLCIECHRDVTPDFTAALEQVTVPHQPVEKGECTSCHNAHGAPNPKLLLKAGADLCFSCHAELGKRIRQSPYKHGPVEEGDCAGCHQPHGSKHPYILNTYFPKAFYVPYAPRNYALCFECHNPDIVRDERTETLTNFRNGDRNLHYLHVNKKKKGRSCKACHEVHAGPQKKHIRAEVPFGEMWSYPIEFTQTETGGGCLVGCHKPLKYDRDNPVSYH